jgi:tetratricopeptide (TPR) repeat protein
MKIKIFTALASFLILSSYVLEAQNVEFLKTNFRGKEKEFKEAKNQLSNGNKFFELGPGMYLNALDYYLKANKFNPDNAELNFKIGLCYLNTVQKTKSIEYLE